MTVIKYLLCAVLAYLLGSISTGVLVSRALFHDDVRQHGSGGTGATNMLRTYRLKAALLTFAGDSAKAAAAALLGLCAACWTLRILWAHRGNIARLAHGQENKL